jgi:hypothetical protein
MPSDLSQLHVDLVKNEWGAGTQVRVACVTERDGQTEVEVAQPEYFDLLQRPLVDETTGHEIFIEKGIPDEVFPSLVRTFNNEYLFATPPHRWENCHFQDGDSVRMTVQFP